jgi:adenylate cyclase
MEVLNAFRHGLECYRKQRWDDAIRTFRDALHLNPGDFLSQMYLDRCEQLKQAPPPENWDGVFVMKTK